MTVVGIVLGSLALLVAIALMPWLTVRGRVGPEGVEMELRYLWGRIRIPSERATSSTPRSEDEAPDAGSDTNDAETEPDSDGRSAGNVRDWLVLIPDGLKAVVAGLHYLLRRTRIERLRVAGTIGTDDPSESGIAVGAIHALHGSLGPWARAIDLSIEPDFETERTAIVAEGAVHVRVGTLLATPLVMLWHLPKRKMWRAWRAGRRRQSSSRSARERTASLT